MNLSYWEKKSWFSNIDYCVVGSGIVGLSCALQLKKRHPASKIIVLEKGILPQGASTKNAGFACFGSVSEILDDLKRLSEAQLFNLVSQRIEGLNLLLETLGPKAIGFLKNGGYELFLNKDEALYIECIKNIDSINELLFPLFRSNIYSKRQHRFGFKGIYNDIIYNEFEAQIDTGKMMKALLELVYKKGISVINSAELLSFSEDQTKVDLQLKNVEFSVKHLFIATNAFSNQLLELELKPARNQVIITKPIDNLDIKGTFHLDRGYYYFRNIDDRILLGGGRHIDLEQETTSEFGLTERIQLRLEELLHTIIVPQREVEVDMRWSGILGVGSVKEPIVKSVSDRIHCGVRLGGMGVAIGSSVGQRLANTIL